MEYLNTCKNPKLKTGIDLKCNENEAIEVAVIEDNKLINLILCKELHSTVAIIKNLRNCPIKFFSFSTGAEFLKYLEKKYDRNSNLIVFSDFYLEKEMNGAKILKQLKQRAINATVIIMSDTTNKQTSQDTLKLGAHQFIPKDNSTPITCSRILYQMVN